MVFLKSEYEFKDCGEYWQINPKRQKVITINQRQRTWKLIRNICEFAGLNWETVIGLSRVHEICLLRMCIIYFLKQTGLSLKAIGSFFSGRDHSTVLNAIRQIDDHFVAKFKDADTNNVIRYIEKMKEIY